MATRPTQDFEWTGTPVDPGGAKKAAGFLVGERIPASWLDYLFGLIAQWIAYFRDVRDQFWVEEYFLWGPRGTSWGASQTLTQVLPTKVGLSSGSSTAVAILAPNGAASPAPHSSLRLRHNDASNNSGILIHQDDSLGTNKSTVSTLDSLELRMDWRAYLSAVGGNQLNVTMGFHSDPASSTLDDQTAHDFFVFRKLHADTNWQARFGDNTNGATVDTGVPPVANTWQHFRIDYFGASTPKGVANGGLPVVNCYINNSLVASNTTGEAPSGNIELGFMFAVYSTATGPTGNQELVLGPVRIRWNPVSLIS